MEHNKNNQELRPSHFFIGGNDLSDHPRTDLSNKLKSRKAETPEEVAEELKAVASRVARPAICSIPCRVGMDDAIPATNSLLSSSSDAYVSIDLAKQPHLSNAQLKNFKEMVIGFLVGKRIF